MHEFEHGELKSGPSGKGGKVKSWRQAICHWIARGRPAHQNMIARKKIAGTWAHSEKKEARGESYQQEAEGKSHNTEMAPDRFRDFWRD
jgi:hypothetical protein